ncbi:MAG: acyl-ACP--UDP-N-acetylglucosamine O-acyltransferase [Candidatus Eisenbacteria bacterium]|nr:acyl-ACP--UDP-N-acetylglucosamine O-acyltransferase [Candidatus Latescibacterota bacterium]MBD3302095.1 acyl-ACP--UDP-N-acetylglucosamine O-acyltransferase [Candidatus Eisenbacteria bacterium]
MAKIDPTARVSFRAEIAEDVRIGPWCIIGKDVRIAEGSVLDSGVVIDGVTRIGPRCRFHHGAVIGTAPQDLKYRGAPSGVVIGADNVFREYCTVNRATNEGEETIIGDANLVMAYAHIAHNCVLGDRTILANSANLAGHVEMGDYAIIGGVTPVHQFVKIGAHAIIGGGCRVPKDVVPYVRAAGNPLRVAGLNGLGLMRRGFSEEVLSELRKLYRIFFRSNLLVAAALERIRTECAPLPEVDLFCRFVERSERGITR